MFGSVGLASPSLCTKPLPAGLRSDRRDDLTGSEVRDKEEKHSVLCHVAVSPLYPDEVHWML